jgi:hypothetical protein
MKRYLKYWPLLIFGVILCFTVYVYSSGESVSRNEQENYSRQVEDDGDVSDILENEKQNARNQSRNDREIQESRDALPDSTKREVESVQERLRRLNEEN